MDPARWRRLRPLLEQALDLPPERREAFLDTLPESDRPLRGELEALLAQHTGEGGALDRGVVTAVAQALHLDDDADRSGQRVDRYRLVRKLGSGGMGTVYLAERSDGGFVQQVALKLLRGSLGDSSGRERFRLERQILAQLRHPNIASLLDGGETADGAPWFSLEYVDGVSIVEYCRERALGLTERLTLLLKTAEALAYAHRNLVIHRDIKPSNILVEADGRVRLLDFGIAKLLGEDGGANSLTRHAFGPMTPEYAAPEQFRRGPITVATDVYQFGVLAFRVLTGRRPYRADPDDTLGWARAVTEEEPLTLPRALDRAREEGDAPALHYRRALAGDLDAIVRKALAKAPDDRYHSMDALIDDVEAFMSGRPVRARRAGTWYFASRFVKRHRVPVAIASAAAALLVVATGFALHQADVSRREAARAKAEAERANAAMRFVTDMFQVADPGVNRGEQLTASTILAYGTSRLDSLGGQDALRARLQLVIGEVHVTLGDMPRAYAQLAPAIEEIRHERPGDPLTLAHALERGASAASRSGRPEQAVSWANEAIALTGGEDAGQAAIRADAMSTLSSIERDRGHTQGAIEWAEQALALSRSYDDGADGERTARLRHRLSTVYADVARFDEAREELERSREAYVRLFGEDDPRTVRVDDSQGWLLRSVGDLERARAIHERNRERIRRLFGPRSGAYAHNAYNRGLLYRQAGELDAAQAAFAEVVDIWNETSGPHSVEVGWALSNAVGIAMDRHAYAEALRLLEAQRAAWESSMPPGNVLVGNLWNAFARCYVALARSADARDASERSLAILRKAAPATGDLAEALRVRGEIEIAAGDASAAKPWADEALAVAEAAYPQGGEALDALRRWAAGSVRAKAD